MKKLVFMTFALLFFTETALALDITEVFPNPIGDDNNKEFIEIYNPAGVNLSGYVIGDEASNDTLVGIFYGNGTYALIVEEGFVWQTLNSTASIYSAGATLGNNLGNTQDSIFLYSTEKIVLDSMQYTDATEGYSWEGMDGIWQLSTLQNGTPGFVSFSEEPPHKTNSSEKEEENKQEEHSEESADSTNTTNI